MAANADRAVVPVAPADLPVFCPNPRMPLWSNHPRIFIDVRTAGVAKCPYCGTEYRLEPGEKVRAH